MRRVQSALGAALAGGAAVVAIEAVSLVIWQISKLDLFAPKLASDFVIEHTPPDNAIALQKTLGVLALPSALLGGVMFVASLGLLAGLLYALLKPHSRSLAVIGACLITPAAVAFCFPNETLLALAPLLFTGLIVDRLARADPPLVESERGITRRTALVRLAMFSLGGVVVSVVGAFPTYLAELTSRHAGRKLFDFTAPAPRVAGFDIPELSAEITPVEDFYTMRKFATPIPSVPADWKLTLSGQVETPLTFSMDDLLKMPRSDVYLTRQCVSNPVGGGLISTALMSGVPLAGLLTLAVVKAGTVDLVFYGRDGYSESVPLTYAQENGLLTYAMNGVALPEAHGAPVRVEVPGLYGFKNMKWLDRIEATNSHYTAIWEEQGWTANPVVKTMSRIDIIKPDGDGALMAGIAFAGRRSIQKVEVQVNGGDWQAATLHLPPLASQTWVQWRYRAAQRGKLTVTVRATDGDGALQTEVPQKQFPDGASGWHMVTVTI